MESARNPGAPVALTRDVDLLGRTLARVIEESGGPDLAADVDRLRDATTALRRDPTDDNRRAVVGIVSALDADRDAEVARTSACGTSHLAA